MGREFEDIKKGLLEAIDYEKGKLNSRRSFLAVAPLKKYTSKDIKKIRNSTKLSQKMFAQVIGVSNKTIEAWESGRNHPDGAATRLLSLIENDSNFPYDSNLLKSEKFGD